MMVYTTKKLFYLCSSSAKKYVMHISKGFGMRMYLGQASFIMQLLIMYNTEFPLEAKDGFEIPMFVFTAGFLWSIHEIGSRFLFAYNKECMSNFGSIADKDIPLKVLARQCGLRGCSKFSK